jgi:hypothetical protein
MIRNILLERCLHQNYRHPQRKHYCLGEELRRASYASDTVTVYVADPAVTTIIWSRCRVTIPYIETERS